MSDLIIDTVDLGLGQVGARFSIETVTSDGTPRYARAATGQLMIEPLELATADLTGTAVIELPPSTGPDAATWADGGAGVVCYRFTCKGYVRTFTKGVDEERLIDTAQPMPSPDPDETFVLNDLSDVDTSGVDDGDVLTYDGAEWVAAESTGGGGAVDSVNGQTGVVVLDAADVGADATGSALFVTGVHNADTTGVHGIADTSVLATDSEVAAAVAAHVADSTAHEAETITVDPITGITGDDVQSVLVELAAAGVTPDPIRYPDELTGAPDLVGWWKADALTPVVNGSAVASWPDSSGNGRDLAQATGSKQPTYATAPNSPGFNGLPAVRFDGTNDALVNAASGIPVTSAATVFAVVNVTSDSSRQLFVSMTDGSSQAWLYVEAAHLTWLCPGPSSKADSNSFDGSRVGVRVLVGTYDNVTGIVALFSDGRLMRQSTGTGTLTPTALALGADPAGTSEYFGGDIAEAGIYAEALTPDQIVELSAGLAAKYRLPGQAGVVVSEPAAVVADGQLPHELTGTPLLAGWWKADTITPVADGTPVTSWLDSSGNGRTLTQATSGKRPTYRSAGSSPWLNDNPSLRFDGADDTMQLIGSGMTSLAAYSMFCVLVKNTIGNGSYLEARGSGFAQLLYAAGSGTGQLMRAGSAAVLVEGEAIPNKGLLICVGVYDGTTAHLYVNGRLHVVGAVTGATTMSDITVGSNFDAGDYVAADIAEAGIYTSALSNLQARELFAGLADKYGLAS